MENQKQLMHLPEENPTCKPKRQMTEQESTRLLSIFPLEIWILIFDNIFLPEDLNHLEKSSDFFSNLLQKTKILFPEVIRLLNGQFRSRKLGRTPPDLLRCRLACRTWRIGVDSILQRFSNYSNLLEVERRLSFNVPTQPPVTNFFRPEIAAAFLQCFDKEYATKNANPFLSKSVHIVYSPIARDLVPFTKQLLQILETYGHHIWEFGFMLLFSEDPVTPANIWCYNILRYFLQHTPNLKVLKFTCSASRRSSESDEEWKALELSLKSCVFPELKNLRHLYMSDVPTPVFDALLRKYSHVPMLSTCAKDVDTSDMLMYTHSMPNLDQVFTCLPDINKLIQLDVSKALWPLTTLFLNLEIHRDLPDYQQLFSFLENRWASTLTVLKLQLEEIFPENLLRIQVLPSLNLPKLKVFLLVSPNFVPLDFIPPMRNSLEQLVIRYFPRVGGVQLESQFESEGEIKFYKFHKNIMESNIWGLFPKLKTADCYVRVWPVLVQVPVRAPQALEG